MRAAPRLSSEFDTGSYKAFLYHLGCKICLWLICSFNALFAVFNKIGVWGVGGVKIQIHPFSQSTGCRYAKKIYPEFGYYNFISLGDKYVH